MARLILCLLAASLSAVAGCAYVSSKPVASDSKEEGLRYYEPKPLLVVSGSQASVIFVPNYSKAYALRFGTFLAKHDLTAEFQSGMLSKITSNQDSTALSLAILATVNKALDTGKPIFSAFSDKSADAKAQKFQVFEILFDEQGNVSKLKALLVDEQMLNFPVVTNSGAAVPAKGPGDQSPDPTDPKKPTKPDPR